VTSIVKRQAMERGEEQRCCKANRTYTAAAAATAILVAIPIDSFVEF